MNKVHIVPDSRADALLPTFVGSGAVCYYLDEDFKRFLELRSRLNERLEVKNLSGIYSDSFHEIAEPFLDLMARLNAKHDSLEWWGSQVASKNPASSAVQKLITRLFCARQLLSGSTDRLVFVTNSAALAESISVLATQRGLAVVSHFGPVTAFFCKVGWYAKYTIQLLNYLQQALTSKWLVWRDLKRPEGGSDGHRRRILLRSWVTEGNFSESGEFTDRNFGGLPTWLEARGYEVWTLPMFFNLGPKKRSVYRLLRQQKRTFIVPEQYLRPQDYVLNLLSALRMMRSRIGSAEIDGVDVSLIFDEVLAEGGIDVSMAMLNLSHPLLKRLKMNGVHVDAFYYAFENNASEKPFILGCREHYDEALLVGYQHTAYYSDHLSFRLKPQELEHHPLPDRIVCSAPRYMQILKGGGVPGDLLRSGPNLRYQGVYEGRGQSRAGGLGRKRLLLPFTFSEELALELLYKTWEAVGNDAEFQVLIRTHPLLSERSLLEFMETNDIGGVSFADQGDIQKWFSESFAVISTGASITILEAVARGVPVIRVIPDNTFLHDPFVWEGYPLEPITQAAEIRERLDMIARVNAEDDQYFLRLGEQVLSEYFTRPDDLNMEVFDLESEPWRLFQDGRGN